MRLLFKVLTTLMCLGTITPINGQTLLEKYQNHPKTEIDFEISLVTDETFMVSPKNPLIIKSPNKKETFRVYTFTLIWENKMFKAFVGLSDSPFEPNLVTTDREQVQIDKLKLLGNHGQPRPGYEAIEEVKILSDQEIILTANICTWTLDSKGQKTKGSEKTETKIEKYRITESGEIEKVKD